MARTQVPDGHCYVVGDNLKFSRDSRMFGPLPLGLVKAKVLGKLSTSEREWSSLTDDGLQPSGSYDEEDDGVVD
jgi:inner membrane protease subunit 1